MPDRHHKKNFLKLPQYPGGSKAFREFIAENLRYPDAALEAKAEGSVIVGYDILDDGTVVNPHVIKGIGYGCDEEALRLISLLRFEKVKNRGLRVKTTTKTKINFGRPKPVVNFTLSYLETPKKPANPEQEQPQPPVTYQYTIKLN